MSLPARFRPVLSHLAGATLPALALALALAGCKNEPGVTASGTRIYAFDLAGAAKACTASKDVDPGKATPVVMNVGNDGGWCAFTVARDGHPYTAGLVTTRAAHGKVYVHSVGDSTRIDYTPDARYVGPDAFAVELIPGDASVRATVTVTAG